VQYYCRLNATHAIAVVSQWSEPDDIILHRSHGTVWSSTYYGQQSITVINVKDIISCVAMPPHTVAEHTRHFLVEKPGLDVTAMTYGGFEGEGQQEDGEGAGQDEIEDA
jgi:hypothetical protein